MDSPVINWKNTENHFLANPRWPAEVQNFFTTGLKKIVEDQGIQGSIFIPTSGTTATDLRNIKIVWLKKEAFLAAATAVGKHYGFSDQDQVAVTLPGFHVGSLSQEARKFVWNQKLFHFSESWQPHKFFEFLQTYQITHTSLVPTQLFDLVQAGFKAPAHLKCIFLGGGALGQELKTRAQDLGWALQVTYGMTETSALVAFYEGQGFKPLPHAKFDLDEKGFLKIKASSLFSGYFKRSGENLILDDSVLKNGWFTTEDLAEEKNECFQILGRSQDYAKISGEGVYLGRLQTLLQDSWLQAGLNSFGTGVLQFVPSERLGTEIHLVSTLPQAAVQNAVQIFHEKVLPFERIRGFHQVQDLPKTELGKILFSKIKR